MLEENKRVFGFLFVEGPDIFLVQILDRDIAVLSHVNQDRVKLS